MARASRAGPADALVVLALLLALLSLAAVLSARARAAEVLTDGPAGYAIACELKPRTGMPGVRTCAELGAAQRCLRAADFPSRASRDTTGMTIVNRSAQTLKLFWLDFDGNAQLYHTLGPGGRATQSSFIGHNWMVTTQDGICIGIYEAAPISIAFF